MSTARGARPDYMEATCWLWHRSLSTYGYGLFKDGYAHRLTYTMFRGPIPEDKQIDHLCRTRRCVNPWHMELVTRRVNILRGESPTAINARKATCIRGHALTGANLIVRARGRGCRECKNTRDRDAYHKRPAAPEEGT